MEHIASSCAAVARLMTERSPTATSASDPARALLYCCNARGDETTMRSRASSVRAHWSSARRLGAEPSPEDFL
jgi:hypothetical protein